MLWFAFNNECEHIKQTTYSRPIPHTLAHGGSIPPTSTHEKNPPERWSFFMCGGGEHDLRHVRAESNEKPVYEIITRKVKPLTFLVIILSVFPESRLRAEMRKVKLFEASRSGDRKRTRGSGHHFP